MNHGVDHMVNQMQKVALKDAKALCGTADDAKKLHDARQKFFALQFLLRTRLELGESGQDMRASARLLWRERSADAKKTA